MMKFLRLITASISIAFFSIHSFSQWNEIVIPTNNELYAVDIHPSGVCFAGGIDVLKSTDNGDNWTEIVYTGPLALYLDLFVIYSIQILDPNTIVCAGWHGTDNNNVITRTTDGGTTWVVEYQGAFGNGKSFNDVEFFDALNGIAVGDDGIIFKTTDGGNNWTQQTSGTANDLNSVCYAGNVNTIIAAGYQRITTSTNGGLTWSAQVHNLRDIRSLQFEPVNGTLTAAYRLQSTGEVHMLTSSNSGGTWTSHFLYDGDLHCHEVVDADTIYFGNENALYTTFNNTDDFFYVNNDDLPIGRDIEFEPSINLGLLVGPYSGDGKIFKFQYNNYADLTAQFEIITPSSVCQNQPAQYTCSNSSVDSYEWFVNGVSVSTNDTLYYTHPTSGTQLISLSISSFSNPSDDAVNVSVLPEAAVIPFAFSGDTTKCVGQTASFWVNSIAGQTGFQVYKNGTPISFSSSSGNNRFYNLGILSSSCVINIVKWHENACDSAGMTQTVNFIVESYDPASLNFYMTDTLLCLNETCELILPVSNPGYTYSIYNNGTLLSSQPGISDTLTFATNPLTGSHTFLVKSTSDLGGCLTSLTNTEFVSVDPASADFAFSEVYSQNEVPIDLDVSDVVGSIFEWNASGTPLVFNDVNTLYPEIVYPSPTSLAEISLTVENATGCKDSLTLPVTLFNLPPDSTTQNVCWFQEKDLPTVLDKHVDIYGNVVLVGYRSHDGGWWGWEHHATIQKYDSAGDLLWEWNHQSTGYQKQYSIMMSNVVSDELGNYYITGNFYGKEFVYMDSILHYSELTERTSFIMKIDSDGNLLWYTETPISTTSSLLGYADIVYDFGTSNLFISALTMGWLNNFTNGEVDLSDMDPIGIIQIDTAGAYVNHFGIYTFSGNTVGLEIPPGDPSPGLKSCVTGPDLFMDTNGILYVSGEIKQMYMSISLELNIPGSSDGGRRSYIAKLDPYGVDQGWLDLKQTAQYMPHEPGDDLDGEFMQMSMDESNNFYICFNSAGSPYYTVVNDDTLSQDSASYIVKYDANLNHVWTKQFKPMLLKDIFCSGNQVFFTGRIKDYFVEYDGANNGAMVNPETPEDFIVGSIDGNGNLTWLESIGEASYERANFIAGNYCGDLFFSGSIKEFYGFWAPNDTVNCELSGINYGLITGGFMFKLSETACSSTGCQILCDNPSLIPNPIITCSNDTLFTQTFENYQWLLNGNPISGATESYYVIEELGIYTVEVINSLGCSGVSSTAFMANCVTPGLSPDPIISLVDDSYLLTSSFESYQWFLNGEPIAGATDSFFVFVENGSYTVQVTNELGCAGISSTAKEITFVGINTNTAHTFVVYPNPGAGNFYVIGNFDWQHSALTVLDSRGKKCMCDQVTESNGVRLNMTNLESGVYYIVLVTENAVIKHQVILQK